MPLGKRRKKIVIGLAAVILLLLLLMFALPLWLPFAIKPFGSKYGVSYSAYQTHGYARFGLTHIALSNGPVQFSAESVEAYQPLTWLWNLRFGSASNAANYILLNNWKLTISSTPRDPANREPHASSLFTNVTSVASLVSELRHWLPAASLSNGTVQIAHRELSFPNVAWSRSGLAGSAIVSNTPITFAADLSQSHRTALRAMAPSLALSSSMLLTQSAEGLFIAGTNLWRTNLVAIEAEFGRAGMLPLKAAVSAPDLLVPASMVRLPEYDTIRGAISGRWDTDQYTVRAQLSAMPLATGSNFPPADLTLNVSGDTNHAIIETANLTSSVLNAELSRGLELHFNGPLLREPARLKVDADLSHQKWAVLEGTLRAQVVLTPFTDKYPEADFTLEASELGGYSLTAKRAQAIGSFHWPTLALTNASAQFDDGSEVRASGAANLAQREVESFRLDFEGPLARRWLPAGYSYESASLHADAHGHWQNLQHSGHLAVTNFTSPALLPLSTLVSWAGQGSTQAEASVSCTASNATVTTKVRVNNEATNLFVAVDELSISTNRVPILALGEPSIIQLRRETGPNWNTLLGAFALSGANKSLQVGATVTWPSQARVQVAATNLESSLANLFMAKPIESLAIKYLSLTGGWSNGPVRVTLTAAAGYEHITNLTAKVRGLGDLGGATAQVQLGAGASGIAISNLLVSAGGSNVFEMHGFVPVTINPASTNTVQWHSGQQMRFEALSDPNALLWQKVKTLTGVELASPALRVHLVGTPESPVGSVHFAAKRVQFPARTSLLPTVSDVNLELGLDRQRAWLTNCQLLVQQQPIHITGQMPLGKPFWDTVAARHQPNFDQAEGRVEISHADLAAFANLFPALLSPQGELSANVHLVPGGDLRGTVAIEKARTRPLPNIGPLRDIEVRLNFANRIVQLSSASARIGTAPVYASGEGDLHGTDWLRGIAPPFQFALHGTNVPLSRLPDSIIRADLLINISKTNRETPLVSGEARLGDSFYLSDLTDLVPGRVAAPARRPPYFSIEDPGLADWRLNVHVSGAHGIKVRSTVFMGVVGPNMRLQGTLKEPMILGDVRVASGDIRLPFATLAVQQGLVTLTSDDPYRPKVDVIATSKRFGYDVRMRVSGPADQPVIEFTSNPPLSSEQIMLMVTAGEMPRGSYSLTPQQRAQTMALFLGKDMLAKLGFGDTSEERLTFTSGEEISEAGKPTYGIEYKLSKRWSIEGEYDRFNAFNAGVKYKVYSK